MLRAGFIFAGAAAIAAASWVFYILGGFLVYTAIQLAMEDSEAESDYHQNAVLRFLRRILPISENYDGRRLVTRENGRRLLTPLVIVVAAIGMANVVFALDSIPAIFGLTKDAYIIFTANALRPDGLAAAVLPHRRTSRAVIYLSEGLAVILGFIGVKLIIEALHGSHIDESGDSTCRHRHRTSLGFICAYTSRHHGGQPGQVQPDQTEGDRGRLTSYGVSRN